MSVSKALVEAKKLHKNKNLNNALKIYNSILGKTPNNIKAKRGILQIYEGLDPSSSYSTSSHTQFKLLSKLLTENKFSDALLYGRILTELNSKDPRIYNILGATKAKLGLMKEAIVFFKKAIKISPSYHEVHNNIAIVLKNLSQHTDAIRHFDQAIKLMPNYASAYYNLGSLYEKLNKRVELANLINKANNNLSVKDPIIILFQAYLQSSKNNTKNCLKLLLEINPKVLPNNFQIDFYSLSGKTYDKLGDYSKAFENFNRQNLVTESINSGKLKNAKIFLEETKTLKKAWEILKVKPETIPNQVHGSNLVFLVGFPRTGTTLLDTILMGHPQITILEEQPMATIMANSFDGLGTPDDYINLSETNIRVLRETYLDALNEQLNNISRGQVIVDKHPLNTRYLPLLEKVFPRAKFIIALRHPCDCVLSCFMQNFEFNRGTGNFLTLEDAANLYTATMGLWVAIEKRLPLDYRTVRYEDFIDDIEGISKSLIDFLNLPWVEGILDHTVTAKSRTHISTASYNQVTERIYKTAKGRWINYEEQLSGVMSKLSPFIKKFGY